MSEAFQFLAPQKADRPYSISEINEGVSRIIESGNTLVWVEGELSNFKQASSGHCYLRLKDETSQVPAVIWKQTAAGLKFAPVDGMQVLVIASIRVYQKGGYYQLDIHRMQPAGLGALFAAFTALKEKLEKEGLFDAARKRQIPATVDTLGVITSKRGAALFDIVKVVRSRSPRTTIVVIDVPVQGDAAPPAIVQALADMNRHAKADVIIVGRGGGSIEDLWAFNDESVVRAIAASEIPVISAVGHEIDFTIADFAADVRAPTPSAAAEMAVRNDRESSRYFLSLCRRLHGDFSRYYSDARQTFDGLAGRPAWRRPSRLVLDASETSCYLRDRSARALRVFFEKSRQHVKAAALQLNALSPLSVMSRGYSVVSDKKGETVKNSGSLSVGDPIKLYFHRGSAGAKVTEINSK
jgi:exodeoxyribonuclease VII large subunit